MDIFSKASQWILPCLGKVAQSWNCHIKCYTPALRITPQRAHCCSCFLALYRANGTKYKSSRCCSCQLSVCICSLQHCQGLAFCKWEDKIFLSQQGFLAFTVEVWPSQSAFLMSPSTLPWLGADKELSNNSCYLWSKAQRWSCFCTCYCGYITKVLKQQGPKVPFHTGYTEWSLLNERLKENTVFFPESPGKNVYLHLAFPPTSKWKRKDPDFSRYTKNHTLGPTFLETFG